MYINETDDKCDDCGVQDRATEFLHGDPGSDPRYLNKDYCQKCAGKRDIGNCSMCGAVHDYPKLDKDEYLCPKCFKNAAEKKEKKV